MVKAKKKYGFAPDYAIPPGETLIDLMESMDMTQKELSLRLDITPQSLNRIFKGEQPISYETANKLEFVTNLPAKMWNNLEANYREQLAKIEERNRFEADLDWLKSIPVKELIERNFIQASKDKVVQLKEVLKFFGVSSVSSYKSIWDEPKVAARRSTCFESAPGHAAAWIRQGEIQAQKISCNPYSESRFKEALNEIRELTVSEPKVFVPEMQRLCSDAGVAMVLVPRMQKVPWNGATKWISPAKAMILLSIRGKREDKLWFSFFHEAGHVLHDNKKNLYIGNDDKNKDEVEKRADEFASNFLIPSKYKDMIPELNSKAKIISFAKELNISPGIVAGQYQYLTSKWTWYNDLIRKLKWVTD